jgi:polysaccharide pyruvyl transferase WcaK-like protein/sulfatase maturation enzyme AslB (radical SAM superfamily)
MANDICNSRCEMCLIWKQKRDDEISPDALRRLMSDPFFSKVSHVGVTGGEPTLRKDLPDIFEAICSTLPNLKTTSIITNAIREKAVKDRVLACAAISRKYNADFSVMVSLDGLGEVHDTVRGVKGNFESAIQCIELFTASGLTTTFGCTITKSNAPYVDELLDWAEERKIYGRFRAADYIDRLYNNSVLNVIRSFDGIVGQHLGLFFYRLEHSYEKSAVAKKTYRNVRGMLAEGKRRQIGCAHHDKAVVLTSRGELLFCSPKSPNLGSVLTASPAKVYASNISKRREMIEKDCGSCIHDYPSPITFLEKVSFAREHRRRARIYDCNHLVKDARRLPAGRPATNLSSKKVLIVGWYGTETVGDKAILWAIVQRLRQRPLPPESIQLASLYPFVSGWTIREMGLKGVEVVETYTKEFEQACREVDEVVIGGGPLMDLEALNHMLYAFNSVRRNDGIAVIDGCGLGPLSNPRYVGVVQQLLRLASVVTLRDNKSVERSRSDFAITNATVVSDPAVDFVHAAVNQSSSEAEKSTPYVACFLRDWSSEYSAGRSKEEHGRVREDFNENLAKLLAHLTSALELPLRLLPMHCFDVGGDDRRFGRRLAARLRPLLGPEPGAKIEVSRLPVSPFEIVAQMKHATLNVCMRFHSVVFAETLGVPYIAIDYTGGGKIRNFLADRGKLDRLLSVTQIADGSWPSAIPQLLRVLPEERDLAGDLQYIAHRAAGPDTVAPGL